MTFQSAPPHGGRRWSSDSSSRCCNRRFQSAPPARGATRMVCDRCPLLPLVFQSAPPHGGRRARRTSAGLELASGRRSFNPRPRTGGDHDLLLRGCHPVSKFQSAPPARGATLRSGHVCLASNCFNPRPRTGGDRQDSTTRGSSRSAARDRSRRFWRISRFNPRPRTGGDRGNLHACSQAWHMFQSAPPHGGRHLACSIRWCSMLFQSAPPHGGRLQKFWHHWLSTLGVSVSIRAPARGATLQRLCLPTGRSASQVSIRAPARGATAEVFVSHRSLHVSIRAPARGATRHAPHVQVESPMFQSAPPHGGRPWAL